MGQRAIKQSYLTRIEFDLGATATYIFISWNSKFEFQSDFVTYLVVQISAEQAELFKQALLFFRLWLLYVYSRCRPPDIGKKEKDISESWLSCVRIMNLTSSNITTYFTRIPLDGGHIFKHDYMHTILTTKQSTLWIQFWPRLIRNCCK